MTIKDVTVRFVDGIGVRLRGETILDTDEGVYIVRGTEPGTHVTFNWDNITYFAESNYDNDDEPAQQPAQEQGQNPSGLFL